MAGEERASKSAARLLTLERFRTRVGGDVTVASVTLSEVVELAGAAVALGGGVEEEVVEAGAQEEVVAVVVLLVTLDESKKGR